MKLKVGPWISATMYVISSGGKRGNLQPSTDCSLDVLALFGDSSEISESHPQTLRVEPCQVDMAIGKMILLLCFSQIQQEDQFPLVNILIYQPTNQRPQKGCQWHSKLQPDTPTYLPIWYVGTSGVALLEDPGIPGARHVQPALTATQLTDELSCISRTYLKSIPQRSILLLKRLRNVLFPI